MGRPKRREEKVRHIRASILRAAAEVFAANGYEGASMAAIAKAAGYSAPSLYSYFEGKRAMFDALADGIVEDLEELLARKLPDGLGLAVRLELVLRNELRWVEEHRAALIALTQRVPDGGPKVKRSPDFVQLSIDRYVQVLEEHTDEFEATCHEAAYLLWGIIQGAFQQWIRESPGESLEEAAPLIVKRFLAAV